VIFYSCFLASIHFHQKGNEMMCCEMISRSSIVEIAILKLNLFIFINVFSVKYECIYIYILCLQFGRFNWIFSLSDGLKFIKKMKMLLKSLCLFNNSGCHMLSPMGYYIHIIVNLPIFFLFYTIVLTFLME